MLPKKSRGAERRETRRLARPPERLGVKPPETLARRLLSPCDRGKAPPGAPLAAISVRGPVLPGGGRRRKRRLSGRLPPSFSPTASSHRRQPLLVGADGCPRPPECEVTSLARGRRILLHLRHVSGRRPSSEQDERTISTDCQTRSIVLAQNILHCRVGKGGAHQRDAVPTIRIAVGTARQARVFAHPTYSGGNCVHRLSPLIPAEVQRSIAIENALGSETRRWTPASAG